MSAFKLVALVVYTATWLVSISALRPGRSTPPQRLLAAYLTALVLKQSASVPAVSHVFATEVAPAAAVAVDRVLTLAEMYFLVALFLFAARMTRRAVWELLPPIVVGVVAATAILTAPPASAPSPLVIRTALYRNADVDAVHALWFIGSDHLYIIYGLSVALYGARRAIPRIAGPTVRRGLTVAAIGVVATLVFGASEQLVSVALRAGGHDLPTALEACCYVLASLGSMIVPIGLTYPRVGRWWQQRQTLLRTHHLWTRLFAQFPETASIGPPRSADQERRALRRVPWRALRRRTDVRDALRELGPWIAEELPSSVADQAPLVRDALARHHAGEPPLHRVEAPVVAAPTDGSDEADETALIALSRALEAADRPGPIAAPRHVS